MGTNLSVQAQPSQAADSSFHLKVRKVFVLPYHLLINVSLQHADVVRLAYSEAFIHAVFLPKLKEKGAILPWKHHHQIPPTLQSPLGECYLSLGKCFLGEHFPLEIKNQNFWPQFSSLKH